MNELEMLMITESKKKAIDEDVIKRAQKEEYEKARKWKKETLEKLSFLKNYGCTFEDSHSRGSIHINPKGHGEIEVGLNWKYEDFAGKHNSIARYYTDKLLKINWNYSICGGDKSELSLEDFVKALVRRGIVKMEG